MFELQLITIFISAAITHNFVLTYFLGICPFVGVSKKIDAAFGMGIAVTFVMTLASSATWLIYNFLLIKFGMPFLQYASFIIVIASLVQIVEMFIRKTSPNLYKALGIYLPLITTNCAILGLTLFMVLRNYNFLQSIIFALGGGLGFTLALIIMAGIREELDHAEIPESLKGAAITLIVAGMLALAFMGFGGLISA